MRTAHLTRLSTLPLFLVVLACVAAGCSPQLLSGEPVPLSEHVAIIHVGSTVVRDINGQPRRGGAFDVAHFEVAPGSYRLTLVFERPARSLGMKTIPAESGDGVCVLTFDAAGNRQYYLGARAHGDDTNPRWDGRWEAWVRDPASLSEDDIIARCQSAEAPAEAEAAPTPAPARTVLAPLPVPATPPASASPAATVSAGAASPPAGTAGVPPASPAAAVVPAPLPAAPLAPPLRVGALDLRSRRGDARAIDAGYDALTITGIDPAERARLGAALGSAWGTLQLDAADRIVLYRRTRLRPCTRPSAVLGCLEGVGATPDLAPPLELRLEPTP